MKHIYDYPSKLVYRVLTEVTEDENGCWISHFYASEGNYPKCTWQVNKKRTYASAHVVACRAAHGPKPFEGAVVRHKCHNHKCVNPKCLSWGTQAENMQDKVDANRQVKGSSCHQAKLTEQDIPDIVMGEK